MESPVVAMFYRPRFRSKFLGYTNEGSQSIQLTNKRRSLK